MRKGLFTFAVLLLLLPALFIALDFNRLRAEESLRRQGTLLSLEKSAYWRSEIELNFDFTLHSALKTALETENAVSLLDSILPELKAGEGLEENAPKDLLLRCFLASQFYLFLSSTEEQNPAIEFFLVTLDPLNYQTALDKLSQPAARPVALTDPAFLFELPGLFLVEKDKAEFLWTGGRKKNRTLLGLIQTKDFNQAFLVPINYRSRVEVNASP
jgi:hypothetical protein